MATAMQSSIKHLSASGLLSSIPSLYVSRSSEAVNAESVVEEDVPVIDFSLLQGTQEERSQAVRDIGRACEEWGFFMVMNHGVAEELRSAMLAALDEFFDLSDEEKMKYTRKNVLDPVRCGTSFNTEVEEVRYWRDFLKIIVHPEFNSPDNPPGFRNILHVQEIWPENYSKGYRRAWIWHKVPWMMLRFQLLFRDTCRESIPSMSTTRTCLWPPSAFGLLPSIHSLAERC